MSGGTPQVARCEDYDSEVSTAKPGTKTEARRKSASTIRPKARDRYCPMPRDVASDSGSSSHISGTRTVKPALVIQTPASKPTVTQRPAKAKPVLHRSDSQRSKEKDAARPNPRPESKVPCDTACQHHDCYLARLDQWRRSMSHQYPVSGQQYQPTMPHPQQLPHQRGYPQYPSETAQWARAIPQRPPTPMVAPHMQYRQVPAARPMRPNSFHGYSYASVNGMQQPPPAASAYQNIQYTAAPYYQRQPHPYQQHVQYATASPYATRVAYPPPSPTSPAYPTHQHYPQSSPTPPSPVSPTFAVHSAYPFHWSSQPTEPSPVVVLQPAPAPQRRYSGRQPTLRHSRIPGAYPRDDSEDSEAISDSEYDYEEEVHESKHRSRGTREGKHRRSSGSRGQESLRRQYAAAPAAPPRERRDSHDSGARCTHRLDTKADYPPHPDSNRTVRAISPRARTLFTSSSLSSRRPSLSTDASSGKTKATTVSGTSGLVHVIVERNGRPSTYLSREKQQYLESAARSRRAQDDRHQQLLDQAEAYQDARRGPQPEGLTALNIREQPQQPQQRSQHSQHQRRRSSKSHTVHSRSSSSRTHGQGGEGTRIEITSSMINLIPGGITLGMRDGDDGQQTWVLRRTEDGARSGRRDSVTSGSRRGEVRRSGGSHDAAALAESLRESETLRGDGEDLGPGK